MRFGLILAVFSCLISGSAWADGAKTNLTGKYVSPSQVQSIGCLDGNGNPLHQSCNLAAEIDLTTSFHTTAKWVFAVTQGPDDGQGNPGNLNFCFLKDGAADCGYNQPGGAPIATPMLEPASYELNHLTTAELFLPSPNAAAPLLLTQANFYSGGPGNRTLFTMIWAYHPAAGKFEQIWFSESYPGRNEETRIITTGPLAGDIIVALDNPTGHFPWPYGIDVYSLTPDQSYRKILYFVGKSAQVGGPSGTVIDADMPEILHRLGPLAAPAAPQPPAAPALSPTGLWQWFNPGGSIVQINADGTTTHTANGQVVDTGQWTAQPTPGQITISWHSGYYDTWQLSPNGQTMSGHNASNDLPEVSRAATE